MTDLWFWILLACAVGYLTKLAGYLVPVSWLANPKALRAAGAMTIGMLAGLTAMNTLSSGQELVLDARLAALGAAAAALLLRAPFLVVVIVGAAAAALARLAGAP